MRWLILLASVSTALAQSITVSEPDDTDVVSGFSFDFTVDLVSLPTTASVEYYIDQRLAGSSTSSPWTFNWSTFNLWNGLHTVYALALDSGGNIIATSAQNTFTIANGSDTIAVTPSTPFSNTWSGNVTFAVTITRADGMGSSCYLYVDGVFFEQQDVSGTSCNNLNVDTTTLENGTRRICITVLNSSNNIPRGMVERNVNVSNTSTNQVAMRAGSSELFLATSGTAQLAPAIVKADGTTATPTTSLPATDNFNRSNETPLAGNWTTKDLGLVNLTSNAVTGAMSEAGGEVFWNQASFPNNQYSQIKITAFGTGNFIGPTVRARQGGWGYSCSWDGGTMYLSKGVGGVGTTLDTKSKAGSAGDVVRLEANGTAITCKVNGGTELSATDSDIVYGQAGFGTYRDTGTTAGDDWEGGALDGSSQPVAIYVSSNTGIATVSSSGLVTGVAVGDTDVTVFSRGLARTVRVSVNTTNNLPHFSRTGATLTSYTPGQSILMRSWFFASSGSLDDVTLPQYVASGANAWEDTFYLPPFDSETETAYESRTATFRTAMESFAASSGLRLMGIGDGMARLNSELYKATRGVWRTWIPDPVTDAFQWAKDSGFMVAAEMVDEVSGAHGNTPFPPGTVGTGGFTSIASNGAGNCVVNWTNYSTNGAGRFIIAGVTTDTDLNSVSPNLFQFSSQINADSYNFSCPGVASGTYNASSDSSMRMEMLASEWFSGDYVRYDAFTTLRGLITAVSGHQPITWPVNGSADTLTKQNWNTSSIGDYATMFWAASSRRHPTGEFLDDMIGDMRSSYRDFYPVIQRIRPWMMLTPAAGPMYRAGGVPTAVSSVATDGTFTFAAAHGVTTFIPETTRIDVSGSSALNGDFYAVSVPSSTTMRVAYKTPVTTGTGSGGTALFDSGQSFSVSSLQIDADVKVLIVTDPGACQLKAQLYHTFVLSGNSNSNLNRTWYMAQSDSCTATGLIREVPAVSSTGGTAYVIATNTYIAGRNELIVQGVSKKNVVAGFLYPFIQGAAGVRNYGFSNQNPESDTVASSRFQGEPASGDGINYNAGPNYTANGMRDRWDAVAYGSQVMTQVTPLMLQARSGSPDYGPAFTCTKRAGTRGSLIACLNTTDGYHARAFDISGLTGSITRYRISEYGVVTGSASGSTDSLTVGPGEAVVWAAEDPARRISRGSKLNGGIIFR